MRGQQTGEKFVDGVERYHEVTGEQQVNSFKMQQEMQGCGPLPACFKARNEGRSQFVCWLELNLTPPGFEELVLGNSESR